MRRALADARSGARAAWPNVPVQDARFGEELARRVGHGEDVVAALGRLHASDLHFVMACAEGHPAAIAIFENEYVAELRGVLARLGFAPASVDEALRVVALRHVTRSMRTVADLGVLHGVHGSTVSRWVTAARTQLLDATRAQMMRRLRIDAAGLSSVLLCVGSELDLWLSTLDPEASTPRAPLA